jgi:hypothetical protein
MVMKENDPLNPLLREWEAPEPSRGLDARVGAAYRAMHRPSLWRRISTTRVTIPVPVFAALLVLAAVLWLQFRSGPTAPAPPPTATVSPADGGYLSRLETSGFQPLPDGAARVVRKEAK